MSASTPSRALPPVLRHLTTLTPTGRSTFTPPRLTQLQAKAALPSDGRVPGRFANLFVTAKQKPDVRDEDLSETQSGSKLLVAAGGANFRYVTIVTVLRPVHG
jgi:hypothetical protein